MKNNFFSGREAVKDFLNPENAPMLPLVELPRDYYKLWRRKIFVYAKLMSFLPLHNSKSLPAYAMLKKHGKASSYLTESSSGNTVFSLAAIAPHFGYKKIKAFASYEASKAKIDLLNFMNVEADIRHDSICPDPSNPSGIIQMARNQGTQPNWFNPDQYGNPENPRIHSQITAQQLHDQLGNSLSMICAGLGTTGTLLGLSQALKKKRNNLFSLGVVRSPNNPVPGVRTKGLLKEIAFDWSEYVDKTTSVDTRSSYITSLELCRRGLLVGPSSGLAIRGCLDFLSSRSLKILRSMRNVDDSIHVAVICPDGPFLYLKDYFDILGPNFFPKEKNRGTKNVIKSLTARKIISMAFNPKDSALKLKNNIYIIDIRKAIDFKHAYIPGSINIQEAGIAKFLTTINKKKEVIVVCSYGVRSQAIVKQLLEANIKAYNLQGGFSAWSKAQLPRKSLTCKLSL